MPSTPIPLGDPWRQPFRVADARAAGIREGRLRRRDLEHRFRGSRAPAGSSPVEEYSALLRAGERFSHGTAAALLGAPLPRRLGEAIHVTAPSTSTRARSSGIVGHRSGGGSMLLAGLPISAPPDLVVELAGLLTLDELVAVVDHLVLRPRYADPGPIRPFADLDRLRDGLARRSGRGIRLARSAAELARPGCESPRETALRLIAGRAGLPEPECNGELRDADGRIGWFDLVWRRWRVVAEYDGDQHRTSTRQYERDIHRFDRASAIGFRVVRVRQHGILNPAETTARLRVAFRAT